MSQRTPRYDGQHQVHVATWSGLLLTILLLYSGAAVSVEVGDTPPDYLGKVRGGEKVHLSSSAGRIRVVSFWASWCGPCMKELPVLNAIQVHGGAERIQVIAINLEEPVRQFRKAVKAWKDYVITLVHDRRGSIAKSYGVKGIPHMLIIDVDGRVVFQHIGYSDDALEGIVAEINSLLVKNDLQSNQ